jgi:hypothetical protein
MEMRGEGLSGPPPRGSSIARSAELDNRRGVSRPALRSADVVETLDFDLREGLCHHHFYRRGAVAAHVIATSGSAPRVVFAFPAGNTGAGVWFDEGEEPVELVVEGRLAPVERGDGMRGVSVVITARAARLGVRGVVLGSVRGLRDFAHSGEAEAGLESWIEPGPPLVLRRRTLDGRHHVELVITEESGGSALVDAAGRVVITAGPSGAIRLALTALADDVPLTPIPAAEILNDGEGACARSLAALAFLSYEEKLLAGSWRFLTYFGRDTLLSLMMLLPALRPAVTEAGLGAVIERLGPGGSVAHEEVIGEWAARDHLARGRCPDDLREPVYDDSMVDDDFLLAPVVAAYLLDHGEGQARAAAFLDRVTSRGRTYREALEDNLALVLRRARAFADAPGPSTLVRLGEGAKVGEWRDSNEGLGFGRVPFNVNVALIPAALEAAARLFASPLLGSREDEAGEAARALAQWRCAGAFFQVEIPADEARERLAIYAASIGVDPAPALASIDGVVVFPAIALDAEGRPVPVMHSDDSFVLLFTRPDPAYLEQAAQRLSRPFPAGLRTPVGVVVANPAFATCAAQRGLFTSDHYHGTVVWSWQQAMLAAGLRRQLEREDLGARTRAALASAEEALWEVIRAAEPHRTSELWSWGIADGCVEQVAFGAARGHRDESNPVQLWSTVYLAVRAPMS